MVGTTASATSTTNRRLPASVAGPRPTLAPGKRLARLSRPVEDEEADGDEVELGVHEGRDEEAAAAAEGALTDVRVRPDGGVGGHAALEEEAGVPADGGHGDQQRQAQPAPFRERVRHREQPDP